MIQVVDRELFRSPPPWMQEAKPLPQKTQDELQKELDEIVRQEKMFELPFLNGFKHYNWSRTFYESTNKVNLLCAANQIGKSSTQIRKLINWATNQDLWPSLWARKPVQFWYLMPSAKQIDAEFLTKWLQFLPCGSMKDDPYYGWELEKKRGEIIGIKFNSGVICFFKTYSQDPQNLQSGTVDAIFCDEELPISLFSELMFRLAASNGYFHQVFTATLGQDEWRRALEPLESETEFLPLAHKQTVSLYDCMEFEDGSKSHWTPERIKQIEASCRSSEEIQKRIHGRFIIVGGRKYGEFDLRRHLKDRHMVPKTWQIYVGADPGSGGTKEEFGGGTPHYAALVYVAVSPDYRRGRVVFGYLGDSGVRTTAGDLVDMHLQIKREQSFRTAGQYYDFSSRDFYEIAKRNGEHFIKAEKRHDIGVPILNTLFKYDMLQIYDDPTLRKLAKELSTLTNATLKRNAKDNFADALRYACASVPWDWTVVDQAITMSPEKEYDGPLTDMQQQVAERRAAMDDEQAHEQEKANDEFEYWNDMYGNFDG